MSHVLLTYFLAGTLGVLLHIFGVKFPSLKKRSHKANHPFTFKMYLQDDYPAIIASFISVIIVIVCVDELLGLKPELENYIKWFFVSVGFTNSSIVLSALSVASKKLSAVIDFKSNVADGIEPPITKKNVEGAIEVQKKGIEP